LMINVITEQSKVSRSRFKTFKEKVDPERNQE